MTSHLRKNGLRIVTPTAPGAYSLSVDACGRLEHRCGGTIETIFPSLYPDKVFRLVCRCRCHGGGQPLERKAPVPID